MPLKTLSRLNRQLFSGPQAAAFIPAVSLAAFWLGGEMALLATALLAPALITLASRQEQNSNAHKTPMQEATEKLSRVQSECTATGRKSACFALAVDDLDRLTSLHGAAAMDGFLGELSLRLASVLRSGDKVFRVADNRFIVVLNPSTRCDLEAGITLSGRLQGAVEASYKLDDLALYLSASCGFCLTSKSPEATGISLLEAAQTALEDARGHGSGAIRAFTEAMKARQLNRTRISDEVEQALENGQIRAWYQPQVSSDTGEVTGFEALARWEHPEKGMLAPADFLPVIENAGLMPRLAEVMLHEALHALNTWDDTVGGVSNVSINLSQTELRDPNFPDRIKWTLDRFDIPAQRLAIEVLEDVVAPGVSDVVTRNLSTLSQMGCLIDLDDFGTGQTSITSIRRLAINRLKIDRSFVSRVHEDKDQQRMVEAILTMAERLGLETVAEGVETLGEYSQVSLLGCTHIQGYAVSRPLPLERTSEWITRYRDKLAQAPSIGRNAG